MAASVIDRGRFVWFELMTSNPKGAKRFYTEVIGWKLQEWPDPSLPYTMFTANDQPVAGLMQLTEEAKKMGASPRWMSYVGVPSVDETLADAKRRGARALVEPRDIPNVGRFAILADPQGAAIALFSSPKESPPETDAGVGQFSWVELTTTDHRLAWAFYEPLFGWKKQSAFDMGPQGEYLMYGRGQRTYGGMWTRPKELPTPPSWLPYVRVDDVNRVANATKRLGGQVALGPMEVPGGDRIVQCTDPQGAMFAAHEKKH